MILSVLTIGKSASFVLTNENVEEIRRKDFKVSFGNELETILLEAAENGDIQFIKEIFSTEVGLCDNLWFLLIKVLDRTDEENRKEESF